MRAVVASFLLGLVVLPADAAAQRGGGEVLVRVADRAGVAIPFAVVVLQGASRVANDSGVVLVSWPPAVDSLRVSARRIGFSPFDGWLRQPSDEPRATITLEPLAQTVSAVNITARWETPLARQGFYNRMELARRGGFVAQFITPEELEQRNAIRVSQLLEAGTSVRVDRQGGIPILSSRRRDCAVTVLLDGIPARGMVDEIHSHRGRQEIKREYGNDGPREVAQWLRNRNNIDQLVGATNVAAIEVYASANSAPAEIQRAAGAEACAIVAIWTGARQ